jgi:hypothetical protein
MKHSCSCEHALACHAGRLPGLGFVALCEGFALVVAGPHLAYSPSQPSRGGAVALIQAGMRVCTSHALGESRPVPVRVQWSVLLTMAELWARSDAGC